MEYFNNQPHTSFTAENDTQHQQQQQTTLGSRERLQRTETEGPESEPSMPANKDAEAEKLTAFPPPPQPSEAQASMIPVIDGICDEAEAKGNLDIDGNWENLEGLGMALKYTDIDRSRISLTIPDPEAAEKTRPAKQAAVEMLYEHAKQMSKREFSGYLHYVGTVIRGTESWLLQGDMGEGFWMTPWLHGGPLAEYVLGNNEDDEGWDQQEELDEQIRNEMDETMIE